MIVVRILTDNLLTLLETGMALLAALVFVVIFTEIAVREEKSRHEVERLATELGEANRKLREYAIRAEEIAILQERNRLAREIHDGLGHYLTELNMQIKAAEAVMTQNPSQAQEALIKAQSLAENALADVRRSVTALRDDPALKRSLPESIAALLEETRGAGIVSEMTIQGDPRSLPSQALLTLYRAAQEALTNIRKHALASRVDVMVEYRSSTICLILTDNGIGTKSVEGGFGLVGLQERVALLGGSMEVKTAAQQGFGLRLEIPA